MRPTLPSNVTRFRLGLFNAAEGTPYAFLHTYLPLTRMAREDRRLELLTMPRVEARPEDLLMTVVNTWMLHCDAILVSNPSQERDVKLIAEARASGIHIWADWGDDLMNVRFVNPAFGDFANTAAISKILGQVLSMVDVATVVTDTIRSNWAEAGVENTQRAMLLPDECKWSRCDLPRKKVVTWRGMGSHWEDVDEYLPALANVARDPAFADWEWVFFGEPPGNLCQKIVDAAGVDRVLFCPFLPTPLAMMRAWEGVRPFAHLVMLSDNKFGRAKSANAWYEATAIGAAVIAPDFPEWAKCPGTQLYSTSKLEHDGKRTFETVLRETLASWETTAEVKGPTNWLPGSINPTGKPWPDGRFHPGVAAAREAIYPALTMEQNNTSRWAILRKLAALGATAPAAQEAQYSELAAGAGVSL